MILALLSSFFIVFWNLENFFPDRPGFSTKCSAVAKTLMMMEKGKMPDVIALAEVADLKALKRLAYGTSLRKFDYRIVHYDSPDRRGIDCALLYRKGRVKVLRSCPKHIYDSTGAVMRTRDILLVEMDSLDILVNHHPSKVGERKVSGETPGKSSEIKVGKSFRRQMAMDRMNFLCDSLEASGHRHILCVGDFNDDVWQAHSQDIKCWPGTIKYNGKWEKIDGYFARGLTVEEKIFVTPHLLCPDRTFGGMKPFRSWSGPRFIGGVSDHLPVMFHFDLLN